MLHHGAMVGALPAWSQVHSLPCRSLSPPPTRQERVDRSDEGRGERKRGTN